MAQNKCMAVNGGVVGSFLIFYICAYCSFTILNFDFTKINYYYSQDATSQYEITDLFSESSIAPPSLTFLALMHWGWRRCHLHSQAISSPERVAVPNDKSSRFPLSQHADSCNAVSIWVSTWHCKYTHILGQSTTAYIDVCVCTCVLYFY